MSQSVPSLLARTKEEMPVVSWSRVTHDHVVRAIEEYDRLGPEEFFAAHGFSRTLAYDLFWKDRTYPPKALLGTAYEFATGVRLSSADFEGGKSGAVRVLSALGFDVRSKRSDGLQQ
jgi:hypothetical protein